MIKDIFLQLHLLQVLPFGMDLGWSIALIPILPLAGFLILGLFGRKYFKNSSGIIATALLLAATILAIYTAYSYLFEYGKVNGVYEKLVPLKFTWLVFSKGVSIDMGV